MKILFVVSSLSGGGAERVLVNLANRWCSKHEVSVLSLKPEADFYIPDSRVARYRLDIERRHWYHPGPHLAILRGIRRTVREVRPDYVVSFVIKTNIMTLLALACVHVPIVVCEHSIIRRADIDRRQSLLRRILYPRAHRIGLLSATILEEFAAVYPAISRSKLVVIPNPLEKTNALPVGMDLAALFGHARAETDIVIALGRLVPLKGFDRLISAFSIAAGSHPRACLVIFGDGPERERLEGLAAGSGFADRIRLPGITEEVGSALSQSSVFAITSDFEGLPMALIESMQAGIPSVCFDAPGVRDIVENGINGLLIPARDVPGWAEALAKLLDDKSLRERIGGQAREYAKRFDSDTVDSIWFGKVLVR